MFEFLLNNSNTASASEFSTIITVLCAFFLASMIVLTYELTTKEAVRPVNFLQGMALISIVSAMVMQAIGDSLARGLGMLGALAIIRFRTKLDNPRNITFMFAAIAAGISCGVLGFITAFVGTIAFCSAAIILRFSPLANNSELVGNLRVRIPVDGNQENELNKILKKFCRFIELQEVRLMEVKIKLNTPIELPVELETTEISDPNEQEGELKSAVVAEEDVERIKYKEMVYLLSLKKQENLSTLADEIETIPEIRGVRLRLDKQRLSL